MEALGDPSHQVGAPVTAIRPNAPEFFATAGEGVENQFCAVPLLHGGGRHHNDQDQAQRVNQDVAFPALNLLARVVAFYPRQGGCLDTLAIDRPCGWMFIT